MLICVSCRLWGCCSGKKHPGRETLWEETWILLLLDPGILDYGVVTVVGAKVAVLDQGSADGDYIQTLESVGCEHLIKQKLGGPGDEKSGLTTTIKCDNFLDSDRNCTAYCGVSGSVPS
jgi:hypothetical protein